MTEPVHDILSRALDKNGLMDLLAKLSNGLDETVNFGSQILNWDLGNVRGSDEHIPIILSFRHLLELIDSISILVRSSSIDPCKLILRGALETCFSLEYIFESNTTDRCMAFLVWHSHKNLKTYRKLDPSLEQGKQLQHVLNQDKLASGMEIPTIPGLNDAIVNLESLIQQPEYEKAEKEYQRLRNAGIKNPAWYQLFNGPKTIQGLAEHLDMHAFYEIFYRHWSGPTHGTDIIQGKLSGAPGDTAEIIQIRYPKNAQEVTSQAMMLALKTFSRYIDIRIPNKKEEFKVWYLSMREFYMKVTGKEQLLDID